ncbi:MAG TPA: hypothetical protein VFS29_08515 [Motilibacteraceae bacterium]|nr:hypothetical protein [Motilibacteraceae bacterium]
MSKRSNQNSSVSRQLGGRVVGLLIAVVIVLMYLFVLSRGSLL